MHTQRKRQAGRAQFAADVRRRRPRRGRAGRRGASWRRVASWRGMARAGGTCPAAAVGGSMPALRPSKPLVRPDQRQGGRNGGCPRMRGAGPVTVAAHPVSPPRPPRPPRPRDATPPRHAAAAGLPRRSAAASFRPAGTGVGQAAHRWRGPRAWRPGHRPLNDPAPPVPLCKQPCRMCPQAENIRPISHRFG